MNRDNPYAGQVLAKVDFKASYGNPPRDVDCIDEANLATSRMEGEEDMHKPVIDIDLPVKLIPSTTWGHFHLFIDKEMSWEDYQILLRALAVVGIVEPGYVNASIERGYSAVRLPWIRKVTA